MGPEEDPNSVSSDRWSQMLLDRYFARLGRERAFKDKPELHHIEFKEFLNPDPQLKLGAVYLCRWFNREESKVIPVRTAHQGVVLSQNPDYRAKIKASEVAPPRSFVSQPWAWSSPRTLIAGVPLPPSFVNYIELLKELNERETPEMRSIKNDEAERFFAGVKA